MANFYKGAIRPDHHQTKAAVFALIKRNAALIMAKGTGKTFAALELIKLSKVKNVLILTGTKASVENWSRHFTEYVSNAVRCASTGGSQVRIGDATCINIATYAPITNKIAFKPDLIILDESHYIKNRKSKRTKATLKFAVWYPQARRIIMTATPTSLTELDQYTQYAFLGAFDPRWGVFAKEYCEPYGFMMKGSRIRKNMLPRFMSIVKRYTFYSDDKVLNLKEHNSDLVQLNFYRENQALYDVLEKEFILSHQDVEEVIPNTLAQMSKLHQICGGSLVHDPAILLKRSEKLDWLLDFICGTPDKVVVFCAYTLEILRISKALWTLGIKHEVLYGRSKDKLGWLRFQRDPELQVIVCQFRSGAQSIDLQASNKVIYYSLTFHYIDYDQSIGRIRRRGQDRSTQAIHLILKNSIDMEIYRNLNRKGKMAQAIFDALKRKTVDKFNPA